MADDVMFWDLEQFARRANERARKALEIALSLRSDVARLTEECFRLSARTRDAEAEIRRLRALIAHTEAEGDAT